MSTEDLVLKIDKPHFVVKLHKDLLEVDLKDGAKKELEDAIEKNSALRKSLGILFQTIVPLDIPLKDIDSVQVNDDGKLKIMIPMRRDITIPLTEEEAEKLAEKLNGLVRLAKENELKRIAASRELERGHRVTEMEEGTFEARMKHG
jgi:hypothetical protein